MHFSNRRKNLPSSVVSMLRSAKLIAQREEFVDNKIKKLDAELLSYGEQMKRAKPGPALDALKTHAVLVLKQKRRYEIQKAMLEKQRSKMESVASAAESLKKEHKSVLERIVSFLSWNICT